MNTDPHATSTVADCRLIELPRHRHPNGSLTEADNASGKLPFAVRRVFFQYDLPADAVRGAHSHRTTYELVIAVSGSFEVEVFDGVESRTVTLNRPYRGLLITPGIWCRLGNFSGGAVSLVLASDDYDGDAYVRDYDQFMALTRHKRDKSNG